MPFISTRRALVPILAILSLCGSAYAQVAAGRGVRNNPVPVVDRIISEEEAVHMFHSVNESPLLSVVSRLPGVDELIVDRNLLDSLKDVRYTTLRDVPIGEGEVATFELERFEVFSEDVQLIVASGSGERRVAAPKAQFWRGNIAGNPDSSVFLALGESSAYGVVNGVMGQRVITQTAEGTIAYSARNPVARNVNNPFGNGFVCGTKHDNIPVVPNPGANPGGLVPTKVSATSGLNTPGSGTVKTVGLSGSGTAGGTGASAGGSTSGGVSPGSGGGMGTGDTGGLGRPSGPSLNDIDNTPRNEGTRSRCRAYAIAIEGDEEYTALFANPEAAILYAGVLVAGASDSFLREVGVSLVTNYIRVWTTDDPFGAFELEAQVAEFVQFRENTLPNAPRHMVHLLSGKGELAGIANNIGVICDPSQSYAVTTGLSGTFPYPYSAYSRFNGDLFVFTHETGHLFNGVHTWMLADPVEDCLGEDAEECFDVEGDRLEPIDGSLMSYCAFCKFGFAEVNLNFDSENKDERIKPTILSTNCGIAPLRNDYGGLMVRRKAAYVISRPNDNAGFMELITRPVNGPAVTYAWTLNGVRVRDGYDNRYFAFGDSNYWETQFFVYGGAPWWNPEGGLSAIETQFDSVENEIALTGFVVFDAGRGEQGIWQMTANGGCGPVLKYQWQTIGLDRCAADVNGDGAVNGDDYDALVPLMEDGGPSNADFNQDGRTGFDDFWSFFAYSWLIGC